MNYARKLIYQKAAVYRSLGKQASPCPAARKGSYGGALLPISLGRGDLVNFKYLVYPMELYSRLPYGAQFNFAMYATIFGFPTDNKVFRILRQILFTQWAVKPDIYPWSNLKPRLPEAFSDFDHSLPQGEDIQAINRVPMLTAGHKLLQEDWVVAYQTVCGPNPMMITKARYMPNANCDSVDICLTRLPSELNVTGVAAFLRSTNGTSRVIPSLEDLIAAERLFFVDYHVLDGISFKGGTALYQPIALLFLEQHPTTGRRRLMPLTIQLTRSGASDTVYHPNMPSTWWLFAKLQLVHADANVHESVVHLGYTHLAMEPMVVAFHRRLPNQHPILNFMKRHFRHTLSINELGRHTLLSPTGDFAKASSLGLNVSFRDRQQNTVVPSDQGCCLVACISHCPDIVALSELCPTAPWRFELPSISDLV